MFYLHDEPGRLRFTLVDELDAAEAADLEGCWRTAESIRGARALVVDIRRLASLDDTTQALLGRLRAAGADILSAPVTQEPKKASRSLKPVRTAV